MKEVAFADKEAISADRFMHQVALTEVVGVLGQDVLNMLRAIEYDHGLRSQMEAAHVPFSGKA